MCYHLSFVYIYIYEFNRRVKCKKIYLRQKEEIGGGDWVRIQISLNEAPFMDLTLEPCK